MKSRTTRNIQIEKQTRARKLRKRIAVTLIAAQARTGEQLRLLIDCNGSNRRERSYCGRDC